MLEDFFEDGDRWRHLCYSDADRDGAVRSIECEVERLKRGADALGDRLCEVIGGVGKKDSELLSAGAGEKVLNAENAFDALDQLLENVIAGGVAVGVVHALEVVDVQHEHGEILAGADATRDLAVGVEIEGSTIEGAGESIRAGLLDQLDLKLYEEEPEIGHEDAGGEEHHGHERVEPVGIVLAFDDHPRLYVEEVGEDGAVGGDEHFSEEKSSRPARWLIEEAAAVAQENPCGDAEDDEDRDVNEVRDVRDFEVIEDGIQGCQCAYEDERPAMTERSSDDKPAQAEHLHDKREEIELVDDQGRDECGETAFESLERILGDADQQAACYPVEAVDLAVAQGQQCGEGSVDGKRREIGEEEGAVIHRRRESPN